MTTLTRTATHVRVIETIDLETGLGVISREYGYLHHDSAGTVWTTVYAGETLDSSHAPTQVQTWARNDAPVARFRIACHCHAGVWYDNIPDEATAMAIATAHSDRVHADGGFCDPSIGRY